jgi:hypothetical protein
MHKFDEWECYNAFVNQCTCDKSHIKEFYKRFRIKILACGQHLLEKAVRWSYTVPTDILKDYHKEFLEFIDGNGFTVIEFQPNMYHITPNYPESKEEFFPF